MLFRNVFLYISCGLIPLILSDYFMEIPRNMLLFVAAVLEYFSVMRQSAQAGAGFLFLLNVAFLSYHSLCRGETGKLKIEHSSECCGEPSWHSIYIVPVLSACKIDYVCRWKSQEKKSWKISTAMLQWWGGDGFRLQMWWLYLLCTAALHSIAF